MDLFIVITIFGGVILTTAGFRYFSDGFRARFRRSYVHWGNLLLIFLILLSMALMSDNVAWTVAHYISWAAFAGLGIWQIVKYGFLWGLGVWFYNLITVVFVVSMIYAISDLFERE